MVIVRTLFVFCMYFNYLHSTVFVRNPCCISNYLLYLFSLLSTSFDIIMCTNEDTIFGECR
jgi:hypothetical protein